MALDIEYLRSAVFPRDFPPPDRLEVALAGRSNSGKSSFLNSISKKTVAKVSQSPGKTRLLNFFDVAKSYRLVDMPGYGFAKRSPEEVKSWSEMIEGYLRARENLVGLVLLMDIKRSWADEEEMLAQFLRDLKIPFCLVLTKADKLKASDVQKKIKELKKETGHESVFAVSNVKKTGTEMVEEFIYETWIRPFREEAK